MCNERAQLNMGRRHSECLLLLSLTKLFLPVFCHQVIGVPCKMITDFDCLFKDISGGADFVPIASDSRTIESVEIYNSNYSTLTPTFCATFTHMKRLAVIDSKLKSVLPNALDNCDSLEELSIEDNQIETLPHEVFQFNQNLKIINLSGNQLKRLPASLFQNKPKLTKLLLSSNKLEYFNEDMMWHLSSLTELRVDSNELSDLKEKIITKNLPRLERIAITDNDFSCFRLEQMILHYHLKLINFICRSRLPLRSRDYDYRQIYCFEYPDDVYVPMRCLLDEQWEFEKICKKRLLRCEVL